MLNLTVLLLFLLLLRLPRLAHRDLQVGLVLRLPLSQLVLDLVRARTAVIVILDSNHGDATVFGDAHVFAVASHGVLLNDQRRLDCILPTAWGVGHLPKVLRYRGILLPRSERIIGPLCLSHLGV